MPGQIPTLRVYLHGNMLRTARAGTFPFMAVLARTVESQGWAVAFERAEPHINDSPPPEGDFTLLYMKRPIHPRTLTMRRVYHYPFWAIEPAAERWRFAVALTEYDPDGIDPAAAAGFVRRLRDRVLPGPEPRRGDRILVPLQGQLRRTRSFQTMSPVEMLDAVCRWGRPVTATLHPNEPLDAGDHSALSELSARHSNLTLGGDTMALLRDCAWVAAQNSAVAFDGLILGKPAVLFAQSDFHHGALNVAEMGPEAAMAGAETGKPDIERFLFWFLKRKSIDAQAPDASDRILAALRRGGWPI